MTEQILEASAEYNLSLKICLLSTYCVQNIRLHTPGDTKTVGSLKELKNSRRDQM